MTNKITFGEITLKWNDEELGSSATFLNVKLRIRRSSDRKDLYEGWIAQADNTIHFNRNKTVFESPRKKDINKVKEILTERFLNYYLPNYLNDTIKQQCNITFEKV